MSRVLVAALAAGLAGATALPAAADQSYTTRIEPRAFYGATVTLEEGVRVFRPLPVQRHVIINPGSKTPLNLSFNEERSTTYNYHEYTGAPAIYPHYGHGGVGLPFGFDDGKVHKPKQKPGGLRKF